MILPIISSCFDSSLISECSKVKNISACMPILDKKLKNYEAFTIRLELPEGYFENAKSDLGILLYLSFIVPILLIAITFYWWFKYGRDNMVVQTVEFRPPQRLNSATIGLIYKGDVGIDDVTSLLIDLANRGYIKITLEKDLKIIKTVIDYIARVNLEDRYIDKLSNYNSLLAEITRTFKKCNYSLNESKFVKDVFCNMAVFVYFKPNAINYDYKFLEYAYDYLKNNSTELIKSMGYEIDRFDTTNEHFVDNFNKSNSLLLRLYNEKYNKDNKKNSGLLK